MNQAVNAIVYEKNGETYIWTFEAENERAALGSICEFAHRNDLSLDWEDANLIWQRMGQQPETIHVRDLARMLSHRPS
ncbi:hypothetical protein [Blastopirellula retiformator]|uniref:Uncharacterized protein n=1 Tax=Blastopirellula retiformator TaxID=2527970 RepID=A0A5C5V0K4_9BACT|nr:hypothetical protein [Blastopirellula retiformator]TWT31958.1 hypothetical protein Enr8_38840 [Blastopirellula retiformator]